MPLVPEGSASPVFWNTTDILNFARVLINDAQSSLAGQDLADARPYTWTLLNLCYAKLANWLEDSNVESATYAEATLTLPASAYASDPSAQSRLGYDGFRDPTGLFYENPTLPQNLLEPLTLWTRLGGTMQPFQQMRQKLGGLGSTWGNSFLTDWEFRQNSIYFLGGSTTQMDIRMRYIPSLPVLLQPTVDNPNAPIIYFARAGEALAYMVAAEYLEIRNAPNAANMRAKANEQLQIIANKAAKRENQTQTRRKGYGFRRGAGRAGRYVVLG